MTAQAVSLPDWARPPATNPAAAAGQLPDTLSTHDKIKFHARYSAALKTFGGEDAVTKAQRAEIHAGILRDLDCEPITETHAPAGLKLRRVTELELPPPTQWLGRGWLPRREITVVVGEEGIGKSLLWVLFAAHITTGRPFKPFNIPPRAPANVVVVVTEDSAAEVNARLQAAGADLDRVYLYCSEDDGSGTPVFGEGISGDMLLLHGLLEELEDVALLVVDAWLDTVAGALNIKDTQQARAALHPWKQLADFHDLAVILVTHTNRMDTASTRDLMGGTAALRQKARMVLFAARSKQDHDEDRQHLWVGPDKANSTNLSPAVKFELAIEQSRPATQDDPGTTARLALPQSSLMTIRVLLEQWRRETQEANRTPPKSVLAIDAIREFMDNQEMDTVPCADVKAHLRELTYGKTAIEDAMKSAGISRPLDRGGPWHFTLHETPKAQDFLDGTNDSGS